MKYNIILFFILFYSFNVFSNSIQIIDKSYRTVLVLPFENKTGNDAFDYLSNSLQTFISSDLKSLETIFISKKEIPTPTIKTNYTYQTNFHRTLLVINNVTNLNRKQDLHSLSSNLQIDYIIKGTFSKHKHKKWKFHVSLYSKMQNTIIYQYDFYQPQKKILDSIPELTLPLKKYLAKTGTNITITSKPDFVAVFKEKNFLGYTPLTIFLSENNQKITLKKYGYKTRITNITKTNSTHFFIPLVPEKPDKQIIIKTIPSKAKIYFNENFIGFSPISYSPFEQNFILSISKSNYKKVVKKISLDKNKTLFFRLTKSNSKPSLITNKQWSWIMFGFATICTGYGIYNGMQSEYYKRSYRLTLQYDDFQKEVNYYNHFGTALLASLPFWSGVIYFNIKWNNEKDW